MRADALGLWWFDQPVVKAPKAEKPKRTPPPRTWEEPDYLPGLAEAQAFNVPLLLSGDLWAAAQAGERFVYDIECYPNYLLIAFMSIKTGKVIYYEMMSGGQLQRAQELQWLLETFCTVGFNSLNYDNPITAMALAGKTTEQLWQATEAIIVHNTRPQDVLKGYRVKKLNINHIDLIEVAPLRASLKIYGGRMHTKRMQDLPFKPGTVLSKEQIDIVRWYCVNDLCNTVELYQTLEEQIQLRERLSMEHNIDLRSKSDAQIAEAVISGALHAQTGTRPQKVEIAIGTSYKYKVPNFIQYHSANMRWVLDVIRNADFVVDESGSIGMPEIVKLLKIPLGTGVYTMGIGGLHSTESSQAHRADEHTVLIDRDVASYYPAIILNLGLYPQHLGPSFLDIYRRIVARRLEAKKAGNKVIADSLKITINGSFGKLGSKYSILYAPDLMIQVTVTGQLSLLMLIERLEMSGIPVVSANTDGLVIKCPKTMQRQLNAIVEQWEKDTGFETEETQYLAVYSRDVNNYIAVKKSFDKNTKQWLDKSDGCKTKGAYSKPGLQKNPTNTICIDAVTKLLTTGEPIGITIRSCRDITKFVSVRTVKGGAVKDGEYLGKSIRWYYATGVEGEIIYALNGNKVPRSDGARPLLDLPEQFPEDIDYEWYEAEAEKILKEVAYA